MPAASAKRQPKVTKAYSCSNCGKVFRHDVHGKAAAEICCTCPKCGGPCDRYIGSSDKYCASCKNNAEWENAVKYLKDSLLKYIAVSRAQKKRDPEIDRFMKRFVEEAPKEAPVPVERKHA